MGRWNGFGCHTSLRMAYCIFTLKYTWSKSPWLIPSAAPLAAIVPVVGSLSHWMSLLVWAHKRKRYLFGFRKCLKTWNDVFKHHQDETECTAEGSSLQMLKAFARVSQLRQVNSVRRAWFNEGFFLSFDDSFMKLIAPRVFSVPLVSWQRETHVSWAIGWCPASSGAQSPAPPGAPGPALAAASRDEEPILARLPVSLTWTARKSVPEPAASSTDTFRASFPSLVVCV